MTPARAAEVLRGVGGGGDLPLARGMGADSLEFQVWMFAVNPWGVLKIEDLLHKWHGEDSFLDYCRAEWEKESK